MPVIITNNYGHKIYFQAFSSYSFHEFLFFRFTFLLVMMVVVLPYLNIIATWIGLFSFFLVFIRTQVKAVGQRVQQSYKAPTNMPKIKKTESTKAIVTSTTQYSH